MPHKDGNTTCLKSPINLFYCSANYDFLNHLLSNLGEEVQTNHSPIPARGDATAGCFYSPGWPQCTLLLFVQDTKCSNFNQPAVLLLPPAPPAPTHNGQQGGQAIPEASCLGRERLGPGLVTAPFGDSCPGYAAAGAVGDRTLALNASRAAVGYLCKSTEINSHSGFTPVSPRAGCGPDSEFTPGSPRSDPSCDPPPTPCWGFSFPQKDGDPPSGWL